MFAIVITSYLLLNAEKIFYLTLMVFHHLFKSERASNQMRYVKLRFWIILSLFLLFYLFVNYYALYSLAVLLKIPVNSPAFLIIVSLSVLFFPLMSLLAKYSNDWSVRGLYLLSAIWGGILVFFILISIPLEIAGFILNIEREITNIAALMFALILASYSLLNALRLDVRHLEIPLEGLEKEMRIVHISDVHLGAIYGSDYLKRVVELANWQNPNMVLISGDLIDGSADLKDIDPDPLNRFKSEVFMSIGNHEQYEGIEKVKQFLSKTKIRLLSDELVEYKGLQIIGIDNPDEATGHFKKKSRLEKIKINKNKPSILMYHLPLGLEEANRYGINLQLSGHTHNAQMFPLNYIASLFFPRVNGIYEYNGTYLNVLSGTGTWGPPFRLGSRNEIAVIKLVKK